MEEYKFREIQPISFLIGIAVFCTISVIGAVVYSFLLLKDEVDITNADIVINVILAFASVAAGGVAGFLNKTKGIIIGLTVAGFDILLLLIISLFFRDNTPIFSLNNTVRFFLMLVPSLIGSILGVNIRKY